MAAHFLQRTKSRLSIVKNKIERSINVPARRAGVSLGEALKRTKEGSDDEGGRKEPTETSLACDCGGSVRAISGSERAMPFKNSLLGTEIEDEALMNARKCESFE